MLGADAGFRVAGVTLPYKGWLRDGGCPGSVVFHYFAGDRADRPAACGHRLRERTRVTCRIPAPAHRTVICPDCRAKAPPLRAGSREVSVRFDLDEILALDATFGRGRRRSIVRALVSQEVKRIRERKGVAVE